MSEGEAKTREGERAREMGKRDRGGMVISSVLTSFDPLYLMILQVAFVFISPFFGFFLE